MKIAACIKQVPDSGEVQLDAETHRLRRSTAGTMVNPFDTHALEEAVRWRQCLPHTSVCALSMGPRQAQSALQHALSVGADQAVLLCDPQFAGADSYATATVLARAVERLGCRLVFAGRQAIDGDTGQVGPELAALLGWPQLCYVASIRALSEHELVAERMLDNGIEVVKVQLPAVLTVVKGLNQPRQPTLRSIAAARQLSVEVWDAALLGLEPGAVGQRGSCTRVRRIYSPPKRSGGRLLTGSADAMAAAVLQQLAAQQPQEHIGDDG